MSPLKKESYWNIRIEYYSKEQFNEEEQVEFYYSPNHSVRITTNELIDNPEIKLTDLMGEKLLKIMKASQVGIEILSNEQLKSLDDNSIILE